MNRGQLFWGVVLILFGGLTLAGEMGIRLPNGNSLMSLFWPVLLIGFGVWVLLGVVMQRNIQAEMVNIELQNARTARVHISHGAGEFRMHSGANANELLHGSFAGGLEKNVNLEGDTLNVKLRPVNDSMSFLSFGPSSPLNWDVSFNPAIPISLDMNMGANKSEIDLKDMQVTDIRFKSGASEAVITLPAQGRLNVDCEVGAASLTLIVPEGVAVRARSVIGAGEFRIDRNRFPTNESPDFASAPNAVDINVKGGAATVRVR